jgi:hypothetical protein
MLDVPVEFRFGNFATWKEEAKPVCRNFSLMINFNDDDNDDGSASVFKLKEK